MERTLEKVPPIVAATVAGHCDAVHMMLASSDIPEEHLNQALEMAVKHEKAYILQLLIDAGEKNLEKTMYSAGRDGKTRVVDMLMLLRNPVEICFAFLGAMDELRNDMVAYLVRVGHVKGLEKCLVMASCSLWGCRNLEELAFLNHAMEALVTRGAANFEETIYRICGKNAIEHWNGHLFDVKAKIFERLLVWGSIHLTQNFYCTLLLTICVTFYEKLLTYQDWDESSPGLERELGNLNLVAYGFDVKTTLQDMVNLLSIVCKSGMPELVRGRLPDFANLSFQDLTTLLEVAQKYPITISGREWPLQMMRFLFVDCRISELGPSVTLLPLMVAASLDVMLPVLRLLSECNAHGCALSYFRVAISNSQGEAIQYLLDTGLRTIEASEIIAVVRHAICSNHVSGPQGLLFVLHADFLNDPKATLAEAATLAELDDNDPDIKCLLKEHWSPNAFKEGTREAQEHFKNWMLVRTQGNSPLRLEKLPLELQVAIGFVSLYRDCSRAPGSLLSQRQQGALLATVKLLRPGSNVPKDKLYADKPILLSLLAGCLPVWSRDVTLCDRKTTLDLFFRDRSIPSCAC